MYTMINGTYLRNENDDVEAFSNIGKVSTANSTFELEINAKSINDQLMSELESVVKTICGLSDINYELNSAINVWETDPDSPLLSALSEITGAECFSSLEMKHIREITEKDSNGGSRDTLTESNNKEFVIIKDSNGNEEIVVLSNHMPTIVGVAIRADGCQSYVIQEKIINAIKNTYGLKASQIYVCW